MNAFDRQLHRASGSTLFGCRCGHSRHVHRGYRECQVTGCLCHAYDRPTTEEARAAVEPSARA